MTTTQTLAASKIVSVRDTNGLKINDELRAQFPAVFADKPIAKMSDRYEFYPSSQLIKDMAKLGMQLVQIGQQQSQKRDPAGQLHVMRFQPKDAAARSATKVGDSNLEIVILNSHNGRNRFQAYAGVFRLACLNGMVVSDLDLGKVRVKHFGEQNKFEAVKALVDGMAMNVGKIGSKIEAMQKLNLSEAEQIKLAKAMMDVRSFPEWLEAEQLLVERREAEAANRAGNRDLWTTFNVIQENVMKGDIDKTGKGRPSHTRPVSGAFADVAINAAMWDRLTVFTDGLDRSRARADKKAKPVHEPEVEAKKDAATAVELSAEAKREALLARKRAAEALRRAAKKAAKENAGE